MGPRLGNKKLKREREFHRKIKTLYANQQILPLLFSLDNSSVKSDKKSYLISDH